MQKGVHRPRSIKGLACRRLLLLRRKEGEAMNDVIVPANAVRCLCGRIPTVSKGPGGWILACPACQTCRHAPIGGRYRALPDAVNGWNYIVDFLKKKEAS